MGWRDRDFREVCVRHGKKGKFIVLGVMEVRPTGRPARLRLRHVEDRVLRYLHLPISNLKTSYAGTFHGRVEAKHLQGYLNEFCFRFNRRDELFRAFRTVLGIAGRVPGPTRRALYTQGPGRFVHPNPHEQEEHYG